MPFEDECKDWGNAYTSQDIWIIAKKQPEARWEDEADSISQPSEIVNPTDTLILNF